MLILVQQIATNHGEGPPVTKKRERQHLMYAVRIGEGHKGHMHADALTTQSAGKVACELVGDFKNTSSGSYQGLALEAEYAERSPRGGRNEQLHAAARGHGSLG